MRTCYNESIIDPAITRFAPSPTGKLHLGGARTALFCFLLSRQSNGKFFLRLEDTDRSRSDEQHVGSILTALRWLGLDWDGEPIRQSARRELYAETLERLLAEGHAYRCTCSPQRLDQLRASLRQRGEKPKYDGHCRTKKIAAGAPATIRFKNPTAGEVILRDLVKGEVRVANAELDDMVLARSDGSPTYNLGAVVDDLAMGITHVLRGDDHVINSARQLNLYQTLGEKPPVFAHLPMILNQQGERLSKRDAAEDILAYRDTLDILPDALCCYLARLGWSHGDQEIFTRTELIQRFNLQNINKAPARYDEQKLLWMNAQWIKGLPMNELKPLVQERLTQDGINMRTRADVEQLLRYYQQRAERIQTIAHEMLIYYQPPQYDRLNQARFLNDATPRYLHILADQLMRLESWQVEDIKALLAELASKLGIKFPYLGMPMRLALTGRDRSPPVPDLAFFLGREETCKRLRRLRDHLMAP